MRNLEATLEKKRLEREVRRAALRDVARNMYADDDLMIPPNAKVDYTPRDGAWVEAYVWIPEKRV